MNRSVEIVTPPKRILSLVPSQTELLFDLGLSDVIVGVTKFCIYPTAQVKQKTKVGGTKTININQVKKLNPDLIIGNKEENEQGQIEELRQLFPVWMSDISNLTDALDMIGKVGEITGKSEEAGKLINDIKNRFTNLKPMNRKIKAGYFIWRKPYMIAGKGTFIDDMLHRSGLTNAFDMQRYPEITNYDLVHANPDIVLLSSEPYPFKERHFEEIKTLLPDAVVKLVDGEIFSWYGSRLLQAPKYFAGLIDELDGPK